MAQNFSLKRVVMAGILMVLIAVGLYGIIPRLSTFKDSFTVVQAANYALIAAAVAATFVTYIVAAQIYGWLSFKRLVFKNTLLVQLAGLLINRVLPGGIGGLGLNYAYLRSSRHGRVQAATVVGLNNILGFIGHILLAFVVIGSHPHVLSGLSLPAMHKWMVYVCLAALFLLPLVLYVYARRSVKPDRGHRVMSARHVITNYYKKRPGPLLVSLGAAMVLTASNVLSFWLCCQAVGISISFPAVFMVFTAGVLLGTATPTPGGIGGFEAGLVAGLIAEHVSSPLALAAALLYRLVSFWLGLVIGLVAFAVVQSRHLIRW